jgi:ribose transport system permease protein
LGTLGIAQGIALVMTNGESVVGIGPALPRLYATTWLGIPFSILVLFLSTPSFTSSFTTHVLAITYLRSVEIAKHWFWPVCPPYVFMSRCMRWRIDGRVCCASIDGRMIPVIPSPRWDGVRCDCGRYCGVEPTTTGQWLVAGYSARGLTVGVLRNGLNVLAMPSSVAVASIGFC